MFCRATQLGETSKISIVFPWSRFRFLLPFAWMHFDDVVFFSSLNGRISSLRFFIHANDEMLSHCLFTTGGGGAGAGSVGTLAEASDFEKK